jgi:hypothetical protein
LRAAAAATSRNLPDLKIPRYDGSSSFDHFLQAFSNASRLIVMSAQQLSNLFIQHLSLSLAMEFQKIVNDNAPLSFWQHVYVFRQRYLPPMPDQDILEQIYHCKQREDETGLAYFRRLSHLCSLHTLYSDDATPPGLLLARFLNGAQPYYRKAIRIAGITNEAELHKRLHLLDGE